MFILSKADFEEAMADYPDAQKVLKRKAKYVQLSDTYEKHNFLSSTSSQHNLNNQTIQENTNKECKERQRGR